MRSPATTFEPPEISDPLRSFLLDQVGRLERFEFVTIGSPGMPFTVLEVGRSESDGLEIRVPPRLPKTPLPIPKRTQLAEAGFRSADPTDPLEPWIADAADPGDAIDGALATLRAVFDIEVGADVNLLHGSHRAEHEAHQLLDELRARVGALLAEIVDGPPEQDDDGDFIYQSAGVRVIVAPRVVPGALAIVRVATITNVGITVAPELGLFLARLNFGLMFGRFALDAPQQSIWFDETLLGENLTREQLRFTVEIVAETGAEWEGRLQQMFGGHTQRDPQGADHDATKKPGAAGYL